MEPCVQRRRQRGDAFGSLVVLVVLGVAGYFVYKYFISLDQPAPSCKVQLNRCIADCRKTSTEAPQIQACQEACNQKAASCKD